MNARRNAYLRKIRQKALYYNFNAENQKLLWRFFVICIFIVILLIISAFLVWILEDKGQAESSISSFWDGIWWAIVTVATVGYGDKYPITFFGRMVGITLIVAGFASLSIFTGLIASLFVEDRLKGAKGLKQIRLRDHIVLCGWNNTAHHFLRALVEKRLDARELCLLMNETPEFFESIESSYPSLRLSFVRGEATSEDALKRAAVNSAEQIIILADHSLEPASADDRSIIVANAVHFLAKKDKISVQLINNENRQMLYRIGISKVFVWDDLGAYLLADNIADENSLSIFTQIAKSSNSRICTCQIEEAYVGKSFKELFEYVQSQDQGVLIGLISKEPSLELDSIFDDNASAIDQFIKSTLSKSRRMLSENKSSIRINPPKDSVIQDNDQAIILQ